MNKKVLAVALATLMILGMLPALIPIANADTTATPHVRTAATTRDCRSYQTETQFDSYARASPPFCVFLHPGVSDAYKTGWSHTLDTLWGLQQPFPDGVVPGQMDTNAQTRQVFDKYLDYAILASSSDSIGDLQFDISVTANVHGITIYVPPEFKFLAPTVAESVWTDITNDYQFVSITTRGAYDPVAPRWTRIVIASVDILPGVYHVRLFNLRSPDIVGLYHFKIFYKNAADVTVSLGAGNFPIMIVKGELNPAWVEVTVRAHDLPGATALVSGILNATGTTPQGRKITGMAYWGPVEWAGDNPVPPGPIGALYRVFLFGLPAGTYTVKAEASGFKPTTSERFTIDAGQSYHIRIVIIQSPKVSVTVWSKHGTGAIPWHNLWQKPEGTNCPSCAPDDALIRRDIFLSLYDSKGGLLGFWGTDVKNTATFPTSVASSRRAIPLNNLLLYGLGTAGGLQPTATNSHFTLVDNFDLLSKARGLTSTNWEGHVPWDVPDYIQGIVEGQYTVEAYVTGYIMDEADAYQRSLTVVQVGPGVHYELQMDLRRSNWIEDVKHLPGNYLASAYTTVTLTATDTGGEERAAVVFVVTPTMALDGKIDGCDITGGITVPAGSLTECKSGGATTYMGGIVMEGWNGLFPASNDKVRADKYKDYGLNPTASTHSDQAVKKTVKLNGNPYTIKLYMTDMGDPIHGIAGTGWYSIVGGDPQVSVFLCNSPVSLSQSIINASAWISLRSVDFEVPAHSRPWTFPGAEVYVEFKDMKGTVVDSLDPETYGLFQDPGMTVLGADSQHPGFTILGAPTNCHIHLLGSATETHVESYGYTPHDIDNKNCPGQHEHLGVWYYGTDTLHSGTTLFHALLDSRSTRLPAGEYTYVASTYGYVMRRSFPMFIPQSGRADIAADLIQGGQVRLAIEFYNEGIKTNFNGWIVAEVFDAKGLLKGASIYGQAQPNCYTRRTDGFDKCPGTYHQYEPAKDWQIVRGPAQGTGLGYDVAGGRYSYADLANVGTAAYAHVAVPTFPSDSFAQRAIHSHELYNIPAETWANYDAHTTWMTPAEANRVEIPAASSAAVDVYGFYRYSGSSMRTWAGGWPTNNDTRQTDYGLKGTVDIPGWAGSGGGLYTVKVWAFDPFGPNNEFEVSGFSDDWRMYSMATAVKDIQVPWGGVQEVYVAMNNMAKLQGTVRWFDMFGDLRPLPWAQVTATNPALTSPAQGYPAYTSGNGAIGSGSSDPSGQFLMWLPSGSHDVSISTAEASQIWSSAAPSFNAKYTAVVSPGWVGGGDTNLSGSGTPVPEVPAYLLPLTLMAALAASVWLLRKKTSTTSIPVLMK